MLTKRFDDALAWACELHRTQVRKSGGVPYVSHLLAVAALVIEYGGDEDEAVAALLHDAVEDQGGKSLYAEIRARFGDRVAEIVEGCTDADVTPKPPWRERKEGFIRRLADASDSVRLVVAADKLHNAMTTLEDLQYEGAEVWDRFRGGSDGTIWYYGEVLHILEERGPERLAARLREVVRELCEFA